MFFFVKQCPLLLTLSRPTMLYLITCELRLWVLFNTFSVMSRCNTQRLSEILILSERDLRDTGYPHDGRADHAAYRHDRRADKWPYPHDWEIDIQNV